jgi:4-carboxymuconolactone decarboxylase
MDKELFEKGLEIRKSVVGEEYVNKSLANANSFNMPFQELVTTYCWGHVWGREGLEKKTRSMLNIAMLCALNRPHELKIHLRGAVNNGVTPDEIQEILLQVGIYCGVPAALEGFKIATEVLEDMGVEIPKD